MRNTPVIILALCLSGLLPSYIAQADTATNPAAATAPSPGARPAQAQAMQAQMAQRRARWKSLSTAEKQARLDGLRQGMQAQRTPSGQAAAHNTGSAAP